MKFFDYRRWRDNDQVTVWMESWWTREVRPYYKVYPSIVKALMRVPLSVMLSELGASERVFCIRLPDPSPIAQSGFYIESVLCCLTSNTVDKVRRLQVKAQIGRECKSDITFGPSCVEDTDDDSLEQQLNEHAGQTPIGHDLVPEMNVTDHNFIRTSVFRLAVAINLLADDPSIVNPDVLSADHEKFKATGDNKFIEKAKRRGVVGWEVGRDYEVCPHYRRPHFAIRHTGKGRATPRIAAIKGSIVHKTKVTDVPTGFILPDGTELE